jgi:hypothetical protein
MRTIKRYLLKLLAGAVVGAVFVLVVGIIVGFGWGESAIIGACFGAALSTLYGRATSHYSPPASTLSRPVRVPYKRGD